MTSREFKLPQMISSYFKWLQGTSEISEEFTDYRKIQKTSNNFKRFQEIPTEFQWLQAISKQKFEYNSINFRRILVTSGEFKWLRLNSLDFKGLQKFLNNSLTSGEFKSYSIFRKVLWNLFLGLDSTKEQFQSRISDQNHATERDPI